MKRKVLILIDTAKPKVDGVSVFLDNILPYLTEIYEVTIIAPDYGTSTYENARLIKFPVRTVGHRDYGFPKADRKVIKQEVKTCDFVFNHESIFPFSSSSFALRYARKYNKPFFTYVHSIDWELLTEGARISEFMRKIERFLLKIYGRWFLNRCSTLFIPFRTIEDILRKNNIKSNVAVVPIGISDIFKPGESTLSFGHNLVIGYVGRISREKGLDLLISTFVKLHATIDRLCLVIVGDGPDADRFRANENVTVTGFVSQKEVADYLRAMDIFVLPSVTETSSISTLEAMKAGVCCVARDVGCIRDYLQHGHNGYFFNKDDELRDLLETLIKNEELRKKIVTAARERVLSYTWKHTADCLFKVFEKPS